MINKAAFRTALDSYVLNTKNDYSLGGIGTYGEKTLHSVLKYYLEPNSELHEVCCGSFVADIKNERGVFEIQTRSFDRLRKKLEYFLELGVVTVVYPIAAAKKLAWLDPSSGAITKERKSPKRGRPTEIFPELYRIKQQLTHPNLRLKILLLDISELRSINGWSKDKKRGSSRFEAYPNDILGEVDIMCLEDYKKFLPIVPSRESDELFGDISTLPKLPPLFTTRDYARVARVNKYIAGTVLNILHHVGAVKREGKSGNSYLYRVT